MHSRTEQDIKQEPFSYSFSSFYQSIFNDIDLVDRYNHQRHLDHRTVLVESIHQGHHNPAGEHRRTGLEAGHHTVLVERRIVLEGHHTVQVEHRTGLVGHRTDLVERHIDLEEGRRRIDREVAHHHIDPGLVQTHQLVGDYGSHPFGHMKSQ